VGTDARQIRSGLPAMSEPRQPSDGASAPVIRRGVLSAARLVIAFACIVLCVSGCSKTVLNGRATSMLFNPERVGGLPVGDGPSGLRPNAPRPVGAVENTDGGAIDHLALLAVNDIQDFWQRNYDKHLPGNFEPVDALVSYDSTDPFGPTVCGEKT
jgi:hypothetical protein